MSTGARGAAAVVLAGGSSRRFGADKLAHDVDGRAVLSRVLDAVVAVGAGPVVVVGPDRPGITDGWTTVREAPAGGGPVAGLAAGVAHLRAAAHLRSAAAAAEAADAVVLALAGDLPYLTGAALEALLDAVAAPDDPVDVALAVDDTGRLQYLLGAWRFRSLVDALGAQAPLAGCSMHDLVAACRVAPVRLPEPAVGPAPWADVDEAPLGGPPSCGPASTHADP